jgi:lipopolysaccharide biosynthesis glycosyltransferase
MGETVVVVTSADRRYARPLAVALRSMVDNCRADSFLDVHVLDGGLTSRQKKKVLVSLGGAACGVTWHDMSRHARRLAGFPVFGHVSLATYYRFLIPGMIEVPRVIYVDADTVVLGDLTELWMEPLTDYHLLGVQDGTVTNPAEIAGAPDYGLPPDHPRLSAGVLVMNLTKWRAEDPFDALREYFLRYRDRIRFWDQDALNIVLARQWGRVQGGWNYIVDCSQSVPGSPADTMARTRREARIVHYASATKPWHYYASHPAKDFFFEYLDKTVWAGWRPRPPWRALRNPYFWGQYLRKAPLFGRVWAGLRH